MNKKAQLPRANPLPETATPVLGSHLLELEEKQRDRFASQESGQRVKTGCAEVDELLGGGFERGNLVGISSEGIAGRLISLHLLASILIPRLALSPAEVPFKAMVIDTTGSFPLTLLAEILESRIKAAQDQELRNSNQSANHQSTARCKGKQPSSNVDDEVMKCLEMVALSRIFDIEGLWEVLGEVRRRPDSNEAAPKTTETKEIPLEVYDSQDEDMFSDDENISAYLDSKAGTPTFDHQATEVIIVDNMANIINEMYARKEKTEAHNLLSLLAQTLHTLSSTENILTILHNNTVTSKVYNPAPAPPEKPSNKYIPPSLYQKPVYQPPPLPTSIFASNPLKPALGHLFAPFPTLHLFLSPMPKSRGDADIVYGQNNESAMLEPDAVEYCTVLEVLKDETPILGPDRGKGRKFGWREQRWTALKVDAAGTGLVGAFQVKGNMRGMGMEREKYGGLTDLGRMANVHGFGGRRP